MGYRVSWLSFAAKPKITVTVTRTIHRWYTDKCLSLAIEANHLFHKISALNLPDLLLAIAFPYNWHTAIACNSLNPLVWFFRIYTVERVLWGRTSCRASSNPLAWVTRKGQPPDNVSKAVKPNPSDLEGIIARSAVDSRVARSPRFSRNDFTISCFLLKPYSSSLSATCSSFPLGAPTKTSW